MATEPKRVNEGNVALGWSMRRYREAYGMTQPQLAAALGRSINTLRKHEAGERMLRVDDLVRAAEVLGCQREYLIYPYPGRERAVTRAWGATGKPAE